MKFLSKHDPRRHSFADFWNNDFFAPLEEIWKNTPSELKSANAFKFIPAINIKEDDTHYYIEAELAGIKKEDIDISLKEQHLILKGEKKTINEQKKEDYHHMERTYGSFYRSIPLATDVDPEKVNANFQDGLLTIELEKKSQSPHAGRKVNIK